jgi:ABC-2 type transport system ATP-binding protein
VSSAETPALLARGLSKTYRRARRPALDKVSLEIPQGEVFGVIGPNGSGKTTFMCCLLGLLSCDQGHAEIFGLPPRSIEAKSKIGYLPERLRFDVWMTGRRFVAFHHHLSGGQEDERERAVESRLEQVGLDRSAWDRPIKGYSRGMLQRVGLAQALIGRPKVLFLDEPTSGMDPEGAIATRELVQAFAREGGTVLINSHQLEQVAKACDRVAFFKEGALAEIKELKAKGSGKLWRVTWLNDAVSKRMTDARLGALLKRAGAEFKERQGHEAYLKVGGTEAAAKAVQALLRGGLKIIESGPYREDLEKMFQEDKP